MDFCLWDNALVEAKQSEAKIQNEFLGPDRITQGFGLKPGDHAADFGAGHGYFAIAMARLVGREGKVYALDIRQEALDIVRSRARAEALLMVECLRADLDIIGGSRLKDRFCDFVLISDILFQAEHRDMVAREAWRILREGGRMVMKEWDAVSGSSPVGPPPALRVKKDDARALALQAGFQFERDIPAGQDHYALLFIKK